MTIEEAQKLMDEDKPVSYQGNQYLIVGVNQLNDTVTLKAGRIGKDVKVSELENG
ncbi:hypothetical protein [Limosilactobacillus caecicola]|uniref:hypothetical protein n=1 Tax=Limosilactobacillus caecicola TaxID=2941332 RepID=UPI0020401D54|nr:hypothetical protein [Limosilactobacillus caecicola]